MRMFPPGPGGQAHTAPWRRWLLPVALAAGFIVLLAVPHGVAASGVRLTYSRFTTDVAAGTVRAVSIGPDGQVTGQLASGRPFSTTIPAALGGNGLGGQLAAHHVQVSAAAASSSLASVLPGLVLPLLLVGGLLYLGVRSVRRHARMWLAIPRSEDQRRDYLFVGVGAARVRDPAGRTRAPASSSSTRSRLAAAAAVGEVTAPSAGSSAASPASSSSAATPPDGGHRAHPYCGRCRQPVTVLGPRARPAAELATGSHRHLVACPGSRHSWGRR